MLLICKDLSKDLQFIIFVIARLQSDNPEEKLDYPVKPDNDNCSHRARYE